MHAPVAPSIWKLAIVPMAGAEVATDTAITSMRSKLSVSR